MSIQRIIGLLQNLLFQKEVIQSWRTIKVNSDIGINPSVSLHIICHVGARDIIPVIFRNIYSSVPKYKTRLTIWVFDAKLWPLIYTKIYGFGSHKWYHCIVDIHPFYIYLYSFCSHILTNKWKFIVKLVYCWQNKSTMLYFGRREYYFEVYRNHRYHKIIARKYTK
jgi:hypothetical protein